METFYYREEVQEYLLTQHVEPEIAFKASELVRKGQGYAKPTRLREVLANFPIDELFFEVVATCLWLPKRGTDLKPTYTYTPGIKVDI